MSKTTNGAADGGYYAIKGFLYQFDKTLIEVFTNPKVTVAFENQEDIKYENFVIQVKHKETQPYSHSKVRKPIEGLMELFSRDNGKRFCLYCHFCDRQPGEWHLTLSELDSVLGEQAKAQYPKSLRDQFCNSFVIKFSDDYETQFTQTLALIRASFNFREGEAILYHSIFQSKLLKLSLKPKADRQVCVRDLKGFLDDAEVTVSQRAYFKYLDAVKYSKLIKATYFTFKEPNLENFERLFALHCDAEVGDVELSKIATRVARKFFKKGKSPQPYIAFLGLGEDRFKELKRVLYDQGTSFFDGTHFDGDRFRLDELAAKRLDDDTFQVKILSEAVISDLAQKVKLREVFQFFIEAPTEINIHGRHCRIQIDRTDHILQMIG